MAAAAAARVAGYGITAVTLSQTLSGGGKDTEKARPERPIQRWGERAGEAGGRRVWVGGRVGVARGKNRLGVDGMVGSTWEWGVVSTLLYIESQGELYRGKGGAPFKVQRTGGTVRIKEADGIPRMGVWGDGKTPDMSSHVCEFVQSLCVPQELYPLPPSAKAAQSPAPTSGPAGAVGGVAVP